MGIRKQEEYFPRGHTSSKPALRRVRDKLSNKPKTFLKKTKKNIKHPEKRSKDTSKKGKFLLKEGKSTKSSIKPLTYQSLEEGMIILGRIREISPYSMFLCLPGRLSARVSVTAISAPYSDSLSKFKKLGDNQQICPSLGQLFRKGQLVVCSIVEVKKDGNVLVVNVSLEPRLVNKERAHFNIRAGQVIVAAVQSVEDHGFSLHTGISGLTAFLPSRNTTHYVEKNNNSRSLVVGEVLLCLVTECKTAKSASRIEVTVDPDTLGHRVLSDVSSQLVQPAESVCCTVQKVLTKGLVVTAGDQKAYIEDSQLTKCWSSTKEYKTNSELMAFVLYALPRSNFQSHFRPIYLTLKNIREDVTPKITLGEILKGVVTKSGPKGVYLCLGDKKDNDIGNKGFVSIRRLGENIEKDNVGNRFPKGKVVITRILAFDFMEELYNCSLERNSLAQRYTKVEQISIGERVPCEVVDIENNFLILALGSLKLYAFKEHSGDIPYKNLFQHFAIGDIVDARVLSVNPATRQVTVTLKETLIRTPALCSYEAAYPNDSYWGTIRHVRDNSLYVDFYNNVSGSVQLNMPHQTFTPGDIVKCFITYVNVQEEKLLLRLTLNKMKSCKKLSIGDSYDIVVHEVTTENLLVSACDYDGVEGIVPKCHLQDPNVYREGDILKVWLCERKADIYYFSPNPAVENVNKDDNEPIFNHLSNSNVGKKKENEVSDQFDEDFNYALSKTKTEKKLSSNLDKKEVTISSTNNPGVNKLIKCYENSNKSPNLKKKIKPYQSRDESPKCEMLVEDLMNKTENDINFSKITGNDHGIEESRENRNAERVDLKNVQRKKSLTSSKEIDNTKDLVENLSEGNKAAASYGITDVLEGAVKKRRNNNIDDKNASNLKLKKHKKDFQNQFSVDSKIHPTKFTLSESGFFWDLRPEDINRFLDVSNDEAKDTKDPSMGMKKKTVAERRRVGKDEEVQLREVEQALVDSNSNPNTVDQFDRAILARPDDADLWLKYMSHHLQATEIEKARAVARRALQVINKHREVERINVWVAFLNMEHLFGSQETLKETLEEALRTNDEFTIYSKMLQIYSNSNKLQDVEHLVNIIIQKFCKSVECWIQCCSALMKCELCDKARNYLQRAISILPPKEHITLLCKFALLENQHGFVEQAETLFEHILTSYPKRTDVWSVYVDMLVKANKIVSARQILERATKQTLPARKMKMLFSKWLDFEEKHGNAEKVEHVRKKAEAYVNSFTKKLE